MTTRTYPQMPVGLETRLSAIKMAAGEGEDAVWYLSDPACPYPAVVKAALQAWLAPAAKGGFDLEGNLAALPVFQEGASDEQDADQVLDEIQRTIDTMRNIETSLPVDATDERMSILKAKTGLLEKWVSIKERTKGVKQVAEFQRMVVQTLDELADKDVVQKFRVRLAELSET